MLSAAGLVNERTNQRTGEGASPHTFSLSVASTGQLASSVDKLVGLFPAS